MHGVKYIIESFVGCIRDMVLSSGKSASDLLPIRPLIATKHENVKEGCIDKYEKEREREQTRSREQAQLTLFRNSDFQVQDTGEPVLRAQSVRQSLQQPDVRLFRNEIRG